MISVIIPTYNRIKLLGEAVESVLRQTWKEYEIIVVDDGSDDGTREQMGSYPEIRCLYQDHKGMPGAARNKGVEEARGDWVAFLDSDDLWLPDKLELQMKKVLEEINEKGSCSIVHTREIWDREGRIVSQRKQKHKREGDVFIDALRKCIIGPSTVLIDRSLFLEAGGFDEELEIAEDYELWLRITDRFRPAYVDKPLVIKRAGSWDQLSEKYGMIEVFRINALEKLVEKYSWSSKEHWELAVKELLRKYRIHINGLEKRGKIDECADYRARVAVLEKRVTALY